MRNINEHIGQFQAAISARKSSQESHVDSNVRLAPCFWQVFFGFPDLKVPNSSRLREAVQAVHHKVPSDADAIDNE